MADLVGELDLPALAAGAGYLLPLGETTDVLGRRTLLSSSSLRRVVRVELRSLRAASTTAVAQEEVPGVYDTRREKMRYGTQVVRSSHPHSFDQQRRRIEFVVPMPAHTTVTIEYEVEYE